MLLLVPVDVEASPQRNHLPRRIAKLLNFSQAQVRNLNVGAMKGRNRVTITRDMYEHLFAFFPDPKNPKAVDKATISDETINATLARLSPLNHANEWIGRLVGAIGYSKETSTQYSLLFELVPDSEPRILHLVVSGEQLRTMQSQGVLRRGQVLTFAAQAFGQMPYLAKSTSTPVALPNGIDKLNFLIETDYGPLVLSEPLVGKLGKVRKLVNWPFALVELRAASPVATKGRVVTPISDIASLVGQGALKEGDDIVVLGTRTRGANDLLVGRVILYQQSAVPVAPTITATVADASFKTQSGLDAATLSIRGISLKLSGGYLAISGEVEQSIEAREAPSDIPGVPTLFPLSLAGATLEFPATDLAPLGFMSLPSDTLVWTDLNRRARFGGIGLVSSEEDTAIRSALASGALELKITGTQYGDIRLKFQVSSSN